MATTRTASEQITEEVASWPGVEAGPGRRGEFAFRVGSRQIGHLHGDHAAHFSFPKRVWAELFEQGRVVHHPVFPGKSGPAARRIDDEADVDDVIALMRLNYDAAIARAGRPAGASAGGQPAGGSSAEGLADLHPSTPEALPFAPSLHIRAFVLRRERGNLLLYSTAGLTSDSSALEELGGVTRQYLGHGHEAMFLPESPAGPLFVHEADRGLVAERGEVHATFSERHGLDDDFEAIPIPGHTAGSTAYLWESGERRLLFTADTIYLDRGEWRGAVLDSSDRSAYIDSLELLRELEFDVLVPWAATAGQPYYALTDPGDARRRIDALLERVRRGETG
jgi:hypothetical protein